jgi:hypothetical protein
MSAGEIRAGKAFVEVYSKDATSKGLDAIKAKFTAYGAQIAKIGGVAVGTAFTASVAAVMKTIDAGGNIKDLADRFGLGYEAIQRLSYVAKQSGTDLETLVGGIKKMQAGLGGGKLADELKSLGISAESLKGLSPDKQFEKIATAIGKISDPAQRTAAAMAIFGKSGTDLIPVFGDLAKLSSEFASLDLAMSDKAIEDAARLDDELGKLGAQFDKLVMSLGTSLIPMIQKITAAADELNKGVGEDPEVFKDQLWAQFGFGKAGQPGDALLQKRRDEATAFAKRAGANNDAKNSVAQADKNGGTAMRKFLEGLQQDASKINTSAKDREFEKSGKEAGDAVRKILRRMEKAGDDFDRQRAKEVSAKINDLMDERAALEKKQQSFGSFNAKDFQGAAYMKSQSAQIEKLKEIKAELEKLNNKKGGLPVG